MTIDSAKFKAEAAEVAKDLATQKTQELLASVTSPVDSLINAAKTAMDFGALDGSQVNAFTSKVESVKSMITGLFRRLFDFLPADIRQYFVGAEEALAEASAPSQPAQPSSNEAAAKAAAEKIPAAGASHGTEVADAGTPPRVPAAAKVPAKPVMQVS